MIFNGRGRTLATQEMLMLHRFALAATDAGEEILEQRRLDLALQLTEQYKGLMSHWFWGDSVIEWIRQCEITFESEGVLRKLLHADVWPHASRARVAAPL